MTQRLPPHWCMAPIGAFLRRRKESVEPWKAPNQQFAFVGLEDIDDSGRGGVRFAPRPGSEIESLKTVFRAGDVLYGKLRPYLNKVAVAAQDGICSTDIWALEATRLVLPEFAFHVLSSEPFVERVSMLTRGANLPRIDSGTFDDLKLPLPPLSEQRRVVDILQEADAMRRLIADADRKTVELLPAIFHDMFGDPEANPKHWIIKQLGRLLAHEPQNGLYKPSTEYGSGTPIIRITDFYDGRLTTKEFKRVRVSEAEMANYRVNDGNILVNRVNSMEFLGKSALVQQLPEPTIFESNMMRLSLKLDEVEPQFLIELLQSPATLRRLRRRAKHAVNQASVNQGDVMSLAVILPPLKLQQKFARIVAECRSLIASPDGDVGSKASDAHELLAGLLSHAFCGELTATWRQRHAKLLEKEARKRDEALRLAGGKVELSRETTEQELEEILETPTDGQWADLSREQRELWRYIPFEPFTPQSIEPLMRDRLGLDADAIRRHLVVFVARGLLLAVSRPVEDTVSGQVRFDTVFRRPAESERVRSHELERLATEL